MQDRIERAEEFRIHPQRVKGESASVDRDSRNRGYLRALTNPIKVSILQAKK